MKNLKSTEQRRKWLEKKLDLKLKNISYFSLDEEKIRNRNCENMIGVTQVPTGIAGPIVISNIKYQISKRFYLPLATTEGALVASVNRGCKATRLSGGVNVLVENIGTTRGPVFKTKNLNEGRRFITWIKNHFNQLKSTAEKTDRHLQLLKIKPFLIGKNVYLRFVYDTCEAMGMNMVTFATQRITELIKEKTGIKCPSISANFCIDKKASWLNFISGRGKKVWAEAIIQKKIVRKVLKTTPEKIVKVVQKKCWLGSIMAGSLGFNGHYANIVAALFLATGQDMAHVVEGSLGITTAELEKNGDLYFSIYLPDLIVGTVGGGTHLETQKEALLILGLDKGKEGDALRLAEIMGGAVLAGELSLIAALSVGHLTQAHQRLGRGNR